MRFAPLDGAQFELGVRIGAGDRDDAAGRRQLLPAMDECRRFRQQATHRFARANRTRQQRVEQRSVL